MARHVVGAVCCGLTGEVVYARVGVEATVGLGVEGHAATVGHRRNGFVLPVFTIRW